MAEFKCSQCGSDCDSDAFQKCLNCGQFQTPQRNTSPQQQSLNADDVESQTENNTAVSQEASETLVCAHAEIEDGKCFVCGYEVNSNLPQSETSSVSVNLNSAASLNESLETERYIQLSIDGALSPPIRSSIILGRKTNQNQSFFEHIFKKYHSLSKKHVWIGLDNSDIFIVDLNSTNKTGIILSDTSVRWLEPGELFKATIKQLPLQLNLGEVLKLTIQRGGGV